MPFFACSGIARRPWLEGFGLVLERGEVAVLRAPSGAGKTLLLRALADLDPIDAGEVELEGKARDDYTPAAWRSSVVYLHQDPVRLPGTVRDNVECIEHMAVHAGRAAPEAADLDGAVDALTISGGEAQRLALHRALSIEPKVLLLDEATSALDDANARAAEERVRTWVSGGRAALWVSHDDGLAARIGARTIELR